MKFLDIDGVGTLWNKVKTTFLPQDVMVIKTTLSVVDGTLTLSCPAPWPVGGFVILYDTSDSHYQMAYQTTTSIKYSLCTTLQAMINSRPTLSSIISTLFPGVPLDIFPYVPMGVIYEVEGEGYFIASESNTTALNKYDTLKEAYATMMSVMANSCQAIDYEWLDANLT